LVKRLGIANSLVPSLFTKQVWETVFDDLFDRLDFPVPTTPKELFIERLFESYPPSRALALIGYTVAVEYFGSNFYKIKSFGVSYASNRRMKLDIGSVANTDPA
jgi:hypothetical protein